jgi:hypothetical protein
MLWYLDERGALARASVTTGISDGIMTEVRGPGLREGMQVIAGVVQADASETANPFQQQQQQQRRPPGPF